MFAALTSGDISALLAAENPFSLCRALICGPSLRERFGEVKLRRCEILTAAFAHSAERAD
jgi:hypothetical protein